jgi:hypothetical protein
MMLTALLLVLQQSHVAIDRLPRRGFWDYVSILSTIGLVLIGVFTFAAVWYQAIKTADAAQSAAESANAALLNAQAVINTERPWLVAMLVPDKGKPDVFVCAIKNQGNTPAKIISVSATFMFLPSPISVRPEPHYPLLALPNLDLIVHGDSFSVHPGFAPESVIQQADKRATIYERREFLLYFGNVVYRDMLYPEDSDAGRHETKWSFIYNPLDDAAFIKSHVPNQVGTFGPDISKDYHGYT